MVKIKSIFAGDQMGRGTLADYFTGVAAKTIVAGEVKTLVSRQHEFNGVDSFRALLGTPSTGEKRRFRTTLVYLDDSGNDPISDTTLVTWYDTRHGKPRGSEWRLYFKSNAVTEQAEEGDLLVLGRRPDDSLVLIVADGGSTVANQLLHLFNLAPPRSTRSSFRNEEEFSDEEISLTGRLILESLGIEVEVPRDDALETMLSRFGNEFPTTKEFSEFARRMAGELDPLEDPDNALIAWISEEEALFRAFERHLVGTQLLDLDTENFDEFIRFSLSVHNRRKSRVGHALENHLSALFDIFALSYSHGKKTEHNSKPDFLFPGINAYKDLTFDTQRLTMLGAKSTCKDRWRQVLSEARRIPEKHLLTLEPAISENQTNQMKANQLQLVLPKSLHSSFTVSQQHELMTVREFLVLVRKRQVNELSA